MKNDNKRKKLAPSIDALMDRVERAAKAYQARFDGPDYLCSTCSDTGQVIKADDLGRSSSVSCSECDRGHARKLNEIRDGLFVEAQEETENEFRQLLADEE